MKVEIQVNSNRFVGDGYALYLIAEIGINHNGDFELCKKLIDEAINSGADAVKMQKRTIEEMYTKDALDTSYNKAYSFGRTYREHKEKLEFSDEQYIELQKYTHKKGAEFLVSGFDFTSFDFIENVLNCPIHKIASPFVTHYPLLKKVAEYGKPIFLSTGMHNINEIKDAVEFIRKINNKLVVLHTVTMYPAPNDKINLNVLNTFKNELNTLVGYSSHDNTVSIPAAAIALGACVIEKHFTLDKNMKGPDHSASVEPHEMKLIKNYISEVFQSLGSYERVNNENEIFARNKYGVSITSKKLIKKNELITEDNITIKCPGGGISPIYYKDIIGKTAAKDIESDKTIYDGEVFWQK